jgi:hypothetical protein
MSLEPHEHDQRQLQLHHQLHIQHQLQQRDQEGQQHGRMRRSGDATPTTSATPNATPQASTGPSTETPTTPSRSRKRKYGPPGRGPYIGVSQVGKGRLLPFQPSPSPALSPASQHPPPYPPALTCPPSPAQYKDTSRYEAHIWDSTGDGRGRQLHLGSYRSPEVAARSVQLHPLSHACDPPPMHACTHELSELECAQ